MDLADLDRATEAYNEKLLDEYLEDRYDHDDSDEDDEGIDDERVQWAKQQERGEQ